MIISLKRKKLKNGKSSLYLEFYSGSRKDKNGAKKHVRSFEYLKLYLFDKPQNAEQQRKNKETLKLAESILTIRQSDFIKGKYNMRNEKKGQITFLDFFRQMKEERYESNANYGNWDAALKHIERYCPEHVQLKDIDSDFVKGFKKYLDTKAKTKGGTPLSQNSKYTYFNKFRAALREAYNESFIQHDVVKSVKSFEQAESVREYLTHSELQALSYAHCKYPVLKSAFIFSCLTGLRWSDIAKLKWSEVRDEDQGARVIFRQKKTDGLEYLYISGQARKLLGYRKSPSDKVFKGLKYGAHFNAQILSWCSQRALPKMARTPKQKVGCTLSGFCSPPIDGQALICQNATKTGQDPRAKFWGKIWAVDGAKLNFLLSCRTDIS